MLNSHKFWFSAFEHGKVFGGIRAVTTLKVSVCVSNMRILLDVYFKNFLAYLQKKLAFATKKSECVGINNWNFFFEIISYPFAFLAKEVCNKNFTANPALSNVLPSISINSIAN